MDTLNVNGVYKGHVANKYELYLDLQVVWCFQSKDNCGFNVQKYKMWKQIHFKY